ncbi:hypothetical protein K456DRAFT_1475681 [Colletotrichum gloeosporioides 23]|nr:hypothetical protein K456DRAFT_1475681 [Colletotrichum gloeosporioides 23]
MRTLTTHSCSIEALLSGSMGGFGDKVDALLETYSKCLSLLGGLKGSERNSQPRQLRRCVRSDQSEVRRVYSSRLSLNGSHLEKGDAAARSSLKRIIKRLTSAMTRLLRVMTRTQTPAIDYRSLRSLSNSSRLDAVRTINDLSRRLSSTSLKSKSSKKSKRHTTIIPPNKEVRPKHGRSTKGKFNRPEELEVREPMPALIASTFVVPQNSPDRRVSMATMSSGSTKLGEVRPRKLHRKQSDNSADSDVYSMPPTYPLRPYHPETKRKRLWGLFGRG